ERTHLVEEALDGGSVTVRFDERVQRLHEMPRRAIELRLVARMHILRRSPSPFGARRHDLEFDNPLGSEIDLHRSIELLVAERNDYPDALSQGRSDCRFE